MSTSTALSRDAATVVGLAGTALAFAGSENDEAERWLSTLRLYGEAGVLLQTLCVAEVPRSEHDGTRADGGPPGSSDARLAAVLTAAAEFAAQRSVRAVSTVDLLLAAMRVYGEAFDRALDRRGVERIELVERLANANMRRSEQAGDVRPRPANSPG